MMLCLLCSRFFRLTGSRLYLWGSIGTVIRKGCRRGRWCSWEHLPRNWKIEKWIPDERSMWVLLSAAVALALCLDITFLGRRWRREDTKPEAHPATKFYVSLEGSSHIWWYWKKMWVLFVDSQSVAYKILILYVDERIVWMRWLYPLYAVIFTLVLTYPVIKRRQFLNFILWKLDYCEGSVERQSLGMKMYCRLEKIFVYDVGKECAMDMRKNKYHRFELRFCSLVRATPSLLLSSSVDLAVIWFKIKQRRYINIQIMYE